MIFSASPGRRGLYDPNAEHDSGGVAVVADIEGRRSHSIVADGLIALTNLDHRAAAGAEPTSGDGAGILLQLPDEFLRRTVAFDLPEADRDGQNRYAAGIAFLPEDPDQRAAAIGVIENIAEQEELRVLGWRDVPVDPDSAGLGMSARSVSPHFAMLFVTVLRNGRPDGVSGLALDRMTFCLGKRIELETEGAGCSTYFPSLSARTIVYKGMLTSEQLPRFFADLSDPRISSAIAVVHSRFSTNTFPSWPLAHPYRFIAHNGEVNTIRGNRNRMRAREELLASSLIPGDLSRLYPICSPDGSDSTSLDEVLELLHLGGRSLQHAVLMTIPKAWESHVGMDRTIRSFYQFHSSLMEPWDGPACVTFTDGKMVGAVLDRNSLRTGRWLRTKDSRIVIASESGVINVPSDQVAMQLREQFDAAILAVGARGQRGDRVVSGREFAGVRTAVEYLVAANRYCEGDGRR